MKPTCDTCRFWDPHEDSQGTCLRYPPHRRDGGGSIWPITDSDDWCGEHQPAPDAAPAAPALPPADIKPGDVAWEVGQVWETRDGRRADVTGLRDSTIHAKRFVVGKVRSATPREDDWWDEGGRHNCYTGTLSCLDLVRLISPLPAAPAEPAALPQYVPHVVYYDGPGPWGNRGYWEIVADDKPHVTRKIDDRADLILAMDRKTVVGLRVYDLPDANVRVCIEPAPDPDGWIKHDGKSWPEVAPDDLVDVVMRDGEKDTSKAGLFLWSHDNELGDIFAYRPAKKEEE